MQVEIDKGKDMEKNYVVNIKNKVGTIFTFRGDSATELQTNIVQFVSNALQEDIKAVEELLLGASAPQSAVQVVQNAFPEATVVDQWATEQPAQGFAPVAPPVAAAPAGFAGPGTAQKNCVHGLMTKRTGEGQWGPYKAFYCPTPKGTADQCKPVYVKANDPEWATF